MAAKKRTHRKTKKSSNSLFLFIAIVIVLAIISMAIAYFYSANFPTGAESIVTSNTQTEQKETPLKDVKTTLEGTWVSNYDGVILTISGLTFTIESPSVESAANISGNLSVEENIVTFVILKGSTVCANAEGHYLYTMDDRGDLFFKLIKDSCASRKERMTASWFKI